MLYAATAAALNRRLRDEAFERATQFTQFTCYTSTKVQILTPEELRVRSRTKPPFARRGV